RRQRRALVDVEPRLPAGAGPSRVEVRLVAEDAARHVADSERPHLAGQREQARGRERRVAVPDEQEAAAPGGPVLYAAAEHVGLDLEVLAERDERGVGDRELLVRGWHKRQGGGAGGHALPVCEG